jgi:Asp/Glu/hydantoin racemase
MAKLAFIHTVSGLVERFRQLARTEMNDWSTYAVVDESLLLDTIDRGTLSPKTKQRLAGYVFGAADAGADAIVVTCSTLGDVVDAIMPLSPVPLFRIDRGMAEAAVRRARRIGVLATLPTTLKPTASLLEKVAAEAGTVCEVTSRLCEGAFAKLRTGDKAAHDESVRAGFSELATSVDLVVLAQASMADSINTDGTATPVPFLTSPEIGMAEIARCLQSV